MTKEKKDNGVHVQDNTVDAESSNGKESLKAALEALPEDERAEFLKCLGFTQRMTREKKDKGPDPRELFQAAQGKLYDAMPAILSILEECEFPSSFAVTIGSDPEGYAFANLKRVRNKYGPRASDDS